MPLLKDIASQHATDLKRRAVVDAVKATNGSYKKLKALLAKAELTTARLDDILKAVGSKSIGEGGMGNGYEVQGTNDVLKVSCLLMFAESDPSLGSSVQQRS
jgi:hypothetical protein